MQLPPGTKLLNDLQHEYNPATYDPAKRREYYLRTRQLKGRHGSSSKENVKRQKAYNTFLKELPMAVEGADLATTEKFVRSLKGKSDAEMRAIAKRIKAQFGKRDGAKVATIEALIKRRANGKTKKIDPKVAARQKKAVARRISNLRKDLTELNRQLKDALAQERETKAKKDRGPTAADKREAARDAKKYRAKNQQKLATKANRKAEKSSGSMKRDHSVEGIRRRINETQRDLSTALAKQRSLAKATKNG